MEMKLVNLPKKVLYSIVLTLNETEVVRIDKVGKQYEVSYYIDDEEVERWAFKSLKNVKGFLKGAFRIDWGEISEIASNE